MCHFLSLKELSPAFLWILFCLISALVEFSLHIKQNTVIKWRIYTINAFTLWLLPNETNPPSSKTPRIQLSFAILAAVLLLSLLTLKSCTPIQANMNCSRVVTIMILPIVLIATKTHWTTCWKERKKKYFKPRTPTTRIKAYFITFRSPFKTTVFALTVFYLLS